MRIISGKNRGRTIPVPKNFKARPTTDSAKESLFNIINNTYDIDGIKVLDLFTGTGSISYEFASRGVEDITCVDVNNRHTDFIKKTVGQLNFDKIKVIKSDAFIFMKSCKHKYDLIFADPPYALEKIQQIPDFVFKYDLLNNECWLIVEHSNDTDFSKHVNYIETRTYGSVNFSIFEKK